MRRRQADPMGQPELINLGAGAPDIRTPTEAKLAGIAAIVEDQTKYTDYRGIAELRVAIVDKLRRDNGCDYTTEEVFVASGGKFVLFCTLKALLAAGHDRVSPGVASGDVVIPAPHYAAYPRLVAQAGGTPVVVQTDPASGYRVTPDRLAAALTPGTVAVALNSPVNPTGVVYSPEELRALADVVIDRSDALLISDEIYEHFTFDGRVATSIASFGARYRARTITVNGVSKAYGMTGWRIGYAAGPGEVIAEAAAVQRDTQNCPSSISQWAALAALGTPRREIAEMVSSVDQRRRATVEFLTHSTDLTVTRPEGSIYMFADATAALHRHGRTTVANLLPRLETCGVRVAPGDHFGAPTGLRITFALDHDLLNEGLRRLADALR
jgi:aspartate aminotransferase